MKQTDIFLQNAHRSAHAELCAVLYERELTRLSYSEFNAIVLKKQIKSLPFYIKKVARWLLTNNSPLDFDIQNASWFAKQTINAPMFKENERNFEWFNKHVSLGLILPVLMNQPFETKIRLDTVDKIDKDQQRCRLNYSGWFNFTGQALESGDDFLLKPTPTIMGSACAGHRWGVTGRKTPEPLSLRELFLSSMLNWPHFKENSLPTLA